MRLWIGNYVDCEWKCEILCEFGVCGWEGVSDGSEWIDDGETF